MNHRSLCWLLAGAVFCLSLAAAAETTADRTVYVMPMSHGLDQFIANRLTRMHVFQVVTDPAKADAVISDQVGARLEDRLNQLYPPPPPPESKAPAKEKEKTKESDKGVPSILGDTVNKAAEQGSMSLSGRGRGTVFLVDVHSRQVLWSAFERPKGYAPRDLDHTAERIVKRLKADLEPKTKSKAK